MFYDDDVMHSLLVPPAHLSTVSDRSDLLWREKNDTGVIKVIKTAPLPSELQIPSFLTINTCLDSQRQVWCKHAEALTGPVFRPLNVNMTTAWLYKYTVLYTPQCIVA